MNNLIPNVDLRAGKSGDWSIERFTITEREAQFHNLRSLINAGHGDRAVLAGKYTKLKYKGDVIMSDTPAEKRDHFEMVRRAHGTILINGLGLGMVLNACLLKRGEHSVTRAIVIEKSADVIKLAAKHWVKRFGERRVQIIHADALEYQPEKGVRFGAVWHDIWPAICADNLPDMRRLHRKYARIAEWQGSWARSECQRMEREWNRERQLFAAIRGTIGG